MVNSSGGGFGPGGEPPVYRVDGPPRYWSPYGVPPGQPGGPQYPAGPPDRGRRTLVILGTVGVVIVAVIAIVAVVAIKMGTSRSRPDTASSGPIAKSGITCVDGVSDREPESSATDVVSAGTLGFPASVAPGWTQGAEYSMPDSANAVSLVRSFGDKGDWVSQMTVGVTDFDPALPIDDQAEQMVKDIAASSMYANWSPRLDDFTPKAGMLDGIPASCVEVPIMVAHSNPAIRGDDIVLVIVDTAPSTYFLGATPVGDETDHAVVKSALAELRVSAR